MLIDGAKKGGGGGGTEAPDDLRSVQNARIVDLISEGPIKGLVNGLKSVYLDGVPVQNEDGSSNFTGLNFAFMQGTQSQPGLPGFDAVEAERGVAVEVRASTPVTQTISNTSVDHVRVTISVPQLTNLDTSNGNMNGSSFGFAIDVQSAGGGFVQQHAETINGKTTSTYKREVRLALTGDGPWDVRVRRTTPDSTSSTVANKFFWDSLTEIQSVTLRYPNSAVAGTHVSAQQFSRVPTRAYDVLGLMIRVPTNYDPIAGTYSGIWDGTFKIAWTNNPAWVYFDLATHPRYGLGRYIKDHHLDKWQLYEIGRYCDERVPDGNGGTEPRFTCNLYIQTAVQARQALQDLAALFRAVMYWAGGQIGVVQDAPADADMLFTNANIVGNFEYQTASHKKRHSAWTVYYNDLTQMSRRMPVVHISKDLVKTMGVVMETFSPIGCTSRGQALRLARWAEFSEAFGRMVSFRTGAEGAALRPGAVFKVADRAKAGKRLGGRVSSSTTSAVTLDADVSLELGETYTLEVMLVDDTEQLGYRTEKRAVVNAAGPARVLQVSPPFTAAPAKAAIWVLQPNTIQPTWWRLVAKKEASGGKEFEVVAIEHDPDKFDAIEQGLKLAPKPTSGLSVLAPQLGDFSITEVPYLGTDSTRIKALVSWTAPTTGLRFQVEWRQSLSEWTTMPQTSANSVEIDGLAVGNLDVRVSTVNSLGLASQPALKSVSLIGWVDRPPSVEDFAASAAGSGIVLRWAAGAVSNYRETVIRQGATLGTAVEIFRGAANGTTWHPPLSGSYTFWAHHENTAGKASELIVSASADWVERSNLGIKINTAVFSGATNFNEAYIHGRDSTGAAVDGPGSILINGVPTLVPNGPLYTNFGPVAAFIVWASSGAEFSVLGTATRPYVMARKGASGWEYDDNNGGTWTPFAVEPRHYIIGTIVTGAPDAGNPGSPPGILAATMWPDATTPDAIASLSDAGHQAQADADAALATLAAMRSDSVIDASEKPGLIKLWNEIVAEYATNSASADSLGIVAEKAAYDTAYSALSTYRSGLSPSLADTTSDTPITAAVDQAKWADYYVARASLRSKITAEAAKRANWDQVGGQTTFRVIAAGYGAVAPYTRGLWRQGAPASGVGRSYSMWLIRRTDGAIVYSATYDVFASPSQAAALAADLNARGTDVVVVICSDDEPQGNRLSGGLAEALYRCGASRAVFGSPQFKSRAAYVLVGIPGCGEGNGAEAYQGAVDNDANAWVDLAFQIVGGSLVGVTANYTPRSLQDYGYTGALNATSDLVLVNRSQMLIEGNTVSKVVGTTFNWDSSVTSRDGYVGGAVVSFVPVATNAYFMMGLNTDPESDNSYESLDFCWYVQGDGQLQARQQGGISHWDGTYAAGDVLAISYDGSLVRYLKNGVVIVQTAASITAPVFLDSTFYSPGGKATGLRFTPQSSNAWSAIGGSNKPLDNAGKVIDTRSSNDPPSAYGVGNWREFKSTATIGISSSEAYCVVETIKGWSDSSGGQATQWAYVASGEVWKRSAPASAGAWGAWVRDLDRALFTGDLTATQNDFVYSPSAPSSPSFRTFWVDTSVVPRRIRVWSGSGWLDAGTFVTSTSDVVDGAGLGLTSLWAGVTGSGKPADSATRNQVFFQDTDPTISPGGVVDGAIWITSTRAWQRVGGAWRPYVGPGSVGTSELGTGSATDVLWTSASDSDIFSATGSTVGTMLLSYLAPYDCDVVVSTTGNIDQICSVAQWSTYADITANTSLTVSETTVRARNVSSGDPFAKGTLAITKRFFQAAGTTVFYTLVGVSGGFPRTGPQAGCACWFRNQQMVLEAIKR